MVKKKGRVWQRWSCLCNERGHVSGWYASYWNAFLFWAAEDVKLNNAARVQLTKIAVFTLIEYRLYLVR